MTWVMKNDYKENWNKLWSLIFNQHNVEWWNKKKLIKKNLKNPESTELTFQTCDLGYKTTIIL
jgi:hypothetical protein